VSVNILNPKTYVYAETHHDACAIADAAGLEHWYYTKSETGLEGHRNFRLLHSGRLPLGLQHAVLYARASGGTVAVEEVRV